MDREMHLGIGFSARRQVLGHLPAVRLVAASGPASVPRGETPSAAVSWQSRVLGRPRVPQTPQGTAAGDADSPPGPDQTVLRQSTHASAAGRLARRTGPELGGRAGPPPQYHPPAAPPRPPVLE